jgi:hypothetical protein
MHLSENFIFLLKYKAKFFNYYGGWKQMNWFIVFYKIGASHKFDYNKTLQNAL